MESIGFIDGDRISQYEHTKSRTEIMSMRDNYLDWMSKYRESRYRIHHQDETWVFKNMCCSKIRKDVESDSLDGLNTVPSGKDDRSIICHFECA